MKHSKHLKVVASFLGLVEMFYVVVVIQPHAKNLKNHETVRYRG